MRRYAGSSSSAIVGIGRPRRRPGTPTPGRSARSRPRSGGGPSAGTGTPGAADGTATQRPPSPNVHPWYGAHQAAVVDVAERQRRLAVRAAVGRGDDRPVGRPPHARGPGRAGVTASGAAAEIGALGDDVPVVAQPRVGRRAAASRHVTVPSVCRTIPRRSTARGRRRRPHDGPDPAHRRRRCRRSSTATASSPSGPAPSWRRRAPGADVLGGPGHLVLPGLVNAHQHLTGDRLVRSTIPDDIDVARRPSSRWAVPIHAAHTGDDDELSATLAPRRGGRQRHHVHRRGRHRRPPRAGARRLRRASASAARSGRGAGTSPARRAPGSVDEVLDRQRARARPHGRPPRGSHGWVTLVGHDLMSDELVVAASELARDARHRPDVPPLPDRRRRRGRTSPAPAPGRSSTSTRLGVLGPHVLLAHAVHLDDDEVDVVLGRRRRRRLLPVGLPAPRPGRDARPAATPSSSRPAAGSPSAATARTPATPSTSCAPPPLAAGLARDAATRPTVRRPRRAGAGHDRAAPRPSGWATRSGRWRSASGPTSSSSTRPGRTGCRARPTPCCSSCGRATGATSATSWRPAGSSCATGAARPSTSTPWPPTRPRASGTCSTPPGSIRGRAGRSIRVDPPGRAGDQRSRRYGRDGRCAEPPVNALRPPTGPLDAHRAAGRRHRRVDRLVRGRSRRSSCSTAARTTSGSAPGSASPTRPTGRSSSCWPSSCRPPTRSAAYPQEVLAPFAHLGIELPEHADIDAVAARAEPAGCLAMAPTRDAAADRVHLHARATPTATWSSSPTTRACTPRPRRSGESRRR